MRSAICLLRSQLYQLVRLRYPWVCLIVAAWFGATANATRVYVDGIPANVEELALTVTLVAAAMTGHFVAATHADGIHKNILQAPDARLAYVAALLPLCALVSLAFFGVALAAQALALLLGGLNPTYMPPNLFWQGAAYVFLRVVLTASLAAATGNKVVGVFAGFLLGFGIADAALLVCEPLDALATHLSECGLLFTSITVAGKPFTPHAALAIALVVATAAALACWAMHRRDVTPHAD